MTQKSLNLITLLINKTNLRSAFGKARISYFHLPWKRLPIGSGHLQTASGAVLACGEAGVQGRVRLDPEPGPGREVPRRPQGGVLQGPRAQEDQQGLRQAVLRRNRLRKDGIFCERYFFARTET